MIAGFIRFKGRLDRRPGLPIEPFGQYWRRRARDWRHWAAEVFLMYLQMQEVWLATRLRTRRQSIWSSWRLSWDEMRGWFGQSGRRASRALAGRIADLRAGAEESWLRATRLRRQGGDDLARRWAELRGEAENAWQRASGAGSQRADDLRRRLVCIRAGVEDLWLRAGESGRQEARAGRRLRRLGAGRVRGCVGSPRRWPDQSAAHQNAHARPT